MKKYIWFLLLAISLTHTSDTYISWCQVDENGMIQPEYCTLQTDEHSQTASIFGDYHGTTKSNESARVLVIAGYIAAISYMTYLFAPQLRQKICRYLSNE